MRLVLFLVFFVAILCAIDVERDFSGRWILVPARSTLKPMPFPVEETLDIASTSDTLSVTSPLGMRAYSSVASSTQSVASLALSSRTKWEGAALLIHSLTTSGRQLSITDRWRLSADRNTLTIRRQHSYGIDESESTLTYRREGALREAAAPTISAPPRAVAAAPVPQDLILDAGTKILLRVTTPISTKTVQPGDRLYLETAVPVVVNNTIVIPPQTQVTARVIESTRAGKVKGKSELALLFDSITLSNGVHRPIQSRLSSADGRPLEKDEGRVSGDSEKVKDTAKVGGAAGTGAALGRIAGRTGIGAAAGAAAGLASVLSARGPDVVLQPGTTLEISLDRQLRFTHKELAGLR